MAGIHGKNARLYIATNQTAIASGTLIQTASGERIFQIAAADRNWIFQPGQDGLPAADRFAIFYRDSGGTWKTIGNNNNQINYAGGAVFLPDLGNPDTAEVFVFNAYRSDLTEVGQLEGQNRSIELNFNQDTVDATIMGDAWGTELPGIPTFGGTIDGLFLSGSKYKKAVLNASGIQLARIIRILPTPEKSTTYYQGVVRFSGWKFSAAYDGPIEESLDFSGQGPLDYVESGSPFFATFT